MLAEDTTGEAFGHAMLGNDVVDTGTASTSKPMLDQIQRIII